MQIESSLVRLFFATTLIGVGLTTDGAVAADSFDGTYVGKVTNSRVIRSLDAGPGFCARSYDIKFTVTGTTIVSENLSNGMRGTGVVQSDGSFTVQGALGPRVVSTSIGRIQDKLLTGEYLATSRATMCEGTMKATRQ